MVAKWYLNMEAEYPDGTRKRRSGTRISLSATPSLAVRFATDPRVNWTVSYANSPDEHADYVDAPAFSATQSRLVDGAFRTELEVPVVNGRTYTIEARRAGNNARVLREQYETWQRIYYTVHYMNDECRAAFNAIEQDLIRVFADANIELKLRKKLRCRHNGANIDEAYTTTEQGTTLPNTWDRGDAPLDRAPNHIRMVVVRDLCTRIDGGVEWTMDRTTTANENRKIRVSSAKPDHSRIIYENEIATFDQDQPFKQLSVHAILAPTQLPGSCVVADADFPGRMLEIDLKGHPSLEPILTRVCNGKSISFSGTVRARRCRQGWASRYSHATSATLSSTTSAQAPVAEGSAKLWIADDRIVIEDPRMFLDADRPAETVEVRYGETEVTLDENSVTRENDHRLSIALDGNRAIIDWLAAGEAIELSLARRGPLALGDDIDAPADFPFKFKTLVKHNYDWVISGKLQCLTRYISSGNDVKEASLKLQGDELAMLELGSLTAQFGNVSPSVQVPNTVITGHSPHHAEIDLRGDPSLAPIADAIQNGASIKFEGKFNGRESIGGYSPAHHRWFVALSIRALPGWDQRVVQRRLKLIACHEIGHALGLVHEDMQNLRSGANEDNDRWYDDDHGGQGPHCNFNAHLVAAGAASGSADTLSGQIYRWNPDAGGNLCIMYHACDHEHSSDEFCDRCRAHLMRGVCNFGPEQSLNKSG